METDVEESSLSLHELVRNVDARIEERDQQARRRHKQDKEFELLKMQIAREMPSFLIFIFGVMWNCYCFCYAIPLVFIFFYFFIWK